MTVHVDGKYMHSGMCFQANCISCGSLLSVKWTNQINKMWTFACSLLLCLIWTHSAFFYLGISINQHGVYIYIYINWCPQIEKYINRIISPLHVYIYVYIYIYIGVVEKNIWRVHVVEQPRKFDTLLACQDSGLTQRMWSNYTWGLVGPEMMLELKFHIMITCESLTSWLPITT